MGSLKQYRTYAAHSSSTYMSNLPAYDSRKFTISLSSVSCRRGSTTWIRALRIELLQPSTSFVRAHGQPPLCQRLKDELFFVCSISVKRQKMRIANMVNTALRRDGLADISLSSTDVRFIPGKRIFVESVG